MRPINPLITISDVREVDDAGGTHHEAILTGRQIVDLIDEGLLKFEGNIRPDWRSNKLSVKTKRKVNNWATDLLEGNGVIGNLSIRLDPDPGKTDFEIQGGVLALFTGYFDTAVDSQSRMTAIRMAAENIEKMNPDAEHLLERRFAVRIWIADDKTAARVGSKFNTEGEKVNESAAKSAYSDDFTTDDLANRLIRNSKHLTFNNVEILKNSVSASSAKLFAFNTLSKALEDHWTDVPFNDTERDAQVEFLVKFWDKLVEVRPEFGRLSIEQRRQLRGSSVAGTALSIHGVAAVAAKIWATKDKDLTRLEHLAEPVTTGNGAREVDYFSYKNNLWQRVGVLVSSVTSAGETRQTLRSSFQTRKAVADAMVARVGL